MFQEALLEGSLTPIYNYFPNTGFEIVKDLLLRENISFNFYKQYLHISSYRNQDFKILVSWCKQGSQQIL